MACTQTERKAIPCMTLFVQDYRITIPMCVHMGMRPCNELASHPGGSRNSGLVGNQRSAPAQWATSLKNTAFHLPFLASPYIMDTDLWILKAMAFNKYFNVFCLEKSFDFTYK